MRTRRLFWRKIKRNPMVTAGAIIILAFGLTAVFARVLAPYDPAERVAAPYVRPCAEHLLGTNDIGQDILSEMILGTRVSLTIGIAAALISTVVGAFFGILAGYLGGLADQAVTALTDVMMSLPGLPLTLVLAAYFGGGMGNMIFVICLTSWVCFLPRRLAAGVLLVVSSAYSLYFPVYAGLCAFDAAGAESGRFW